MNNEDTTKMDNVKLTLEKDKKAALVELLYPTLYKFSCILGKYSDNFFKMSLDV